ncbi:Wzz/FepE/Etk N-terminal domain-containing protein [Desulfovulcanus sp.]
MGQKRQDGKEIIYVPAPYPQMVEEDEIDLLKLWDVIWQGKWFIAGFTLICTLIAVYVTLYVLPVIYKSEAVLMPTASQNGMGKLAGLVGNLPIPFDLPGGGKTDNISTFLQSRNLQQRLIEKYNLLPILYKDLWDAKNKKWKVKKPEDAPTVVKAIQSKALSSAFQVSQDKKTNLITISWESEDPKFAALMLERIINELQHYLDNEYESDAKREREFVEKQLAKATKELEYWERQVPTKNLTLSKITRERLAAQTVYTELRKQLELAKIAEAKELITFKVLDPPFVPEKKYKPKRALICAVTMVTSGFLAIFLVFFIRFIKSAKLEGEDKKMRR